MKKKSQTVIPGQYKIRFDDLMTDEPPLASVKKTEETTPAHASDFIRFISFGSGSSGNCYYIGTRRGAILVDAGVAENNVLDAMEENGLSMQSVRAILLTHDHTDHIKYVYRLLRQNRDIRLYCTNRVLNGLLRKHSISKRIKEYHNPIFKEIPFHILDFEITAFDVPHDGSDNMGFSIESVKGRFVIATDLGEVTERAAHYISGARYLVMEANYDLRMLLRGRYPEHLKARIQTRCGHMDNKATGAFLATAASPQLSHIFLCHISQENNTPETAAGAVREALEAAGKKVGDASGSPADRASDIHLSALPRLEASDLFILR